MAPTAARRRFQWKSYRLQLDRLAITERRHTGRRSSSFRPLARNAAAAPNVHRSGDESDIERAAQAVRVAEAARIDTFLSSSDIHLQHQMRMTREQALDRVTACVSYARSFVSDVEFSRMDCDPDRLGLPGRDVQARDRSRRDDPQRPGHRRLHHAGRVRRPDPPPEGARPRHRELRHLRPLPRRPGHGDRQHPRRDSRRARARSR